MNGQRFSFQRRNDTRKYINKAQSESDDFLVPVDLNSNNCNLNSCPNYALFNFNYQKCQCALRAPYRGPLKFYMSISNRPITIIRGDELKSVSFLYRKIDVTAFLSKNRSVRFLNQKLTCPLFQSKFDVPAFPAKNRCVRFFH